MFVLFCSVSVIVCCFRLSLRCFSLSFHSTRCRFWRIKMTIKLEASFSKQGTARYRLSSATEWEAGPGWLVWTSCGGRVDAGLISRRRAGADGPGDGHLATASAAINPLTGHIRAATARPSEPVSLLWRISARCWRHRLGDISGDDDRSTLFEPENASHSKKIYSVHGKFYGNFNNIMSVLGHDRNEISAVHLVKSYCLPSILYGYTRYGLWVRLTFVK